MAATPSTAPLAKSLKIAILGAGIGGASTALALARQGFTDITVFESARALGEVGAGINITPNLARVLKRLDCLDEAAREAVALSGYRVLESDSDEELSYVDMQYLLDDHGMQFLVSLNRAIGFWTVPWLTAARAALVHPSGGPP
jgi:salicylate hydroxylase